MKRILFFLFFSSVIELAKANPTTDKKNKPLVLQMMISHPRNTDQTSLIFRENKVEMVTNTSTWQKSENPKLGRFESSMTPSLKSLKQRLQWYHSRLKQTVPLSSLIKNSRVQPSHAPHSPIFRLNTKEIKLGESFFKRLEDIIQQIGNQKWICVECATYKRHKKGIVRVVRKRKGMSNKKENNQSNPVNQPKKESARWLVQKKILSKKSLNCIRKTKTKWECVDKQFGIFEIKFL